MPIRYGCLNITLALARSVITVNQTSFSKIRIVNIPHLSCIPRQIHQRPNQTSPPLEILPMHSKPSVLAVPRVRATSAVRGRAGRPFYGSVMGPLSFQRARPRGQAGQDVPRTRISGNTRWTCIRGGAADGRMHIGPLLLGRVSWYGRSR